MLSAFVSRYLNGPRERWTLVAIAAVIFVVQLVVLRKAVVVGEPYWIAYYLREGLGFVYYFPWDTALAPTCFIPPLYAYYLYAIFAVGGGILAMQISGHIFFLASDFFLYYFFKRYLPKPLAFAGFLAYLLYVPLWILSEKIDPDGLNILLVTATIYLLDTLRRDPTTRRWILLGVLYGVQILVRPDILIGIVCFGLWLLYTIADKKKFFKGYALTLAIALLMVLPWTIRNYNTFGRFVLVSSNSGYNLYVGNNPAATGEFQQSGPTPESISMDSARAVFFGSHPSPVDRDSYLFKVAVSWALAHPVDVVVLAAKKFYYHWWLRESAGVYISVPAWMVSAYNLASLLLVVLGFIGLFRLAKAPRSLLVTLFAYSTSIAMIFFVQSRHRALKVDPYLIVLSVVGIHSLIVPKKNRASFPVTE